MTRQILPHDAATHDLADARPPLVLPLAALLATQVFHIVAAFFTIGFLVSCKAVSSRNM
jgi:hypothetical protein